MKNCLTLMLQYLVNSAYSTDELGLEATLSAYLRYQQDLQNQQEPEHALNKLLAVARILPSSNYMMIPKTILRGISVPSFSPTHARLPFRAEYCNSPLSENGGQKRKRERKKDREREDKNRTFGKQLNFLLLEGRTRTPAFLRFPSGTPLLQCFKTTKNQQRRNKTKNERRTIGADIQ